MLKYWFFGFIFFFFITIKKTWFVTKTMTLFSWDISYMEVNFLYIQLVTTHPSPPPNQQTHTHNKVNISIFMSLWGLGFQVGWHFYWAATLGAILTQDNVWKMGKFVVNWCFICKKDWDGSPSVTLWVHHKDLGGWFCRCVGDAQVNCRIPLSLEVKIPRRARMMFGGDDIAWAKQMVFQGCWEVFSSCQTFVLEFINFFWQNEVYPSSVLQLFPLLTLGVHFCLYRVLGLVLLTGCAFFGFACFLAYSTCMGMKPHFGILEYCLIIKKKLIIFLTSP